VVQRVVQFVDGPRPKGVANVGSIERDPNRSGIDRPVVRDVLELVVQVRRLPLLRIEAFRNHLLECGVRDVK